MKNLFSSLVLLILVSHHSASGYENPYQLVTDNEYDQALAAISELWLEAESGIFNGKRAVDIHYRIFTHPNEKAAVMISSGLTESFIKYQELIYSLYQNGYSVYIHDHRGQGFSEREVKSEPQMAHVWKFDDYVEDLKAFYQLKVLPRSHKRVFLLAHSMGGGVASLYLQKYPNDFDAAAMSSPMHQPDTGKLGGVACLGAGFTTALRDVFIKLLNGEPRYALGQGRYVKAPFVENSPAMMTHSAVRYNYLAALYEKHEEIKIGGVSSHWLANACRASKKLLKNAKRTQIPVLVLQAEEDIMVTAEGQSRYCKKLNRPDSSTGCYGDTPFIIQGAYHELFIESDQYRIPAVTKILDFYASF